MWIHPFTVISLFSGAGGLDLGFRIAVPAARTILYVEHEGTAIQTLVANMEAGSIDPAPIYSDIRSFDGTRWAGAVDCIVGGFPCTDLSVAGKRAGIDGEHSGLWWEFARVIREVQPGWVFIENVSPVLHLGAGSAVFGELHCLGYDAQWLTLRASDVGASHQRKRAFVLAYRRGEGRREIPIWTSSDEGTYGGGEEQR